MSSFFINHTQFLRYIFYVGYLSFFRPRTSKSYDIGMRHIGYLLRPLFRYLFRLTSYYARYVHYRTKEVIVG